MLKNDDLICPEFLSIDSYKCTGRTLALPPALALAYCLFYVKVFYVMGIADMAWFRPDFLAVKVLYIFFAINQDGFPHQKDQIPYCYI